MRNYSSWSFGSLDFGFLSRADVHTSARDRQQDMSLYLTPYLLPRYRWPLVISFACRW